MKLTYLPHLVAIGLLSSLTAGPLCAYSLWWFERTIYHGPAGVLLWGLGWILGEAIGWYFFGKMTLRAGAVRLLLSGAICGTVTGFLLLLIWSEREGPPLSVNLILAVEVGMIFGFLAWLFWFRGHLR